MLRKFCNVQNDMWMTLKKWHETFNSIYCNVFLQHLPLQLQSCTVCIPFSQKAVFYNYAQHTKTKARNAQLTEGYRTISFTEGLYRYASLPQHAQK